MTERSEGLRKEAASGWETAALALVLSAAVAARAWLLWSTPLVPGMNGGYYLIQARALLEHGMLGIPDLPLTFFVQSLLAKLLALATGRSLEASILLSVRLCDALLPPLAAVPVFLLGRTWCRREGRGSGLALAAAAVSALGLPALSMTGDFEKNSLGLVWLAGLVVALHAWMSKRTRVRAAAALALLGLCGLTHIGVFGAALLLAALTWCADLALLRGVKGFQSLRHLLVIAAAGASVIALASGLVLWKFDPARIRRLAGALSNPVVFLQTGGRESGQAPGQAFRGPPPGGAPDFLSPPPDRPHPPPDGRPDGLRRGRMGPPGRGPLPQGLACAAFGLVAAGALVLPWRRRREMPAADRASTFGCAVALILLSGPWVRGDVAQRLWLIAMIPAAFSGAFVLAHLPGRRTAPVCAAACLAILAATTAPLLKGGGRPIISPDAFEELRTLSKHVCVPDRTLVVARHGLEWWTAWTLHTHVAQARAVRADDWAKYREVLFIQEKRPESGGPEGPGGHAPAGGPPPGFGGAPPMMGAEIPETAEILHDGTYFRLARVSQPPESVRSDPTAQ